MKREYLPGVLRVALLQNQWQAVPWYLTTSVTLVNSELLAQGGLKVETVGRDWTTLRAQARQYHTQTGKFLFSMSLGQESELSVMMLADGLPMLVAKGSDRLQANLLDPAIVAMVPRGRGCTTGRLAGSAYPSNTNAANGSAGCWCVTPDLRGPAPRSGWFYKHITSTSRSC